MATLAPLWLVGIFGRGLWTPDEPREADIAWRMSQQSDRTLPELAGTPFLEKPPLTYWVSAASVSLFGDSTGAARAPNLLYALVSCLAIGALALAMELDVLAALLAALVTGSALLTFRVSSWLAPDACLLAGNALALLGLWRGYNAPAGKPKLTGYALMHAGAAIGFMAKSAPGWLVPGLALLALIAWERRWSELRRPELYAGLLLQGLIIGPWLFAVLHNAQGVDALRALFWHNIVGRFTQVGAPAALDYTTGHHNSPGKYLIELPFYLLPWTLIAAAALRRAWNLARAPDASATAWRFAIGASVPFLALLSVAATARDVYAAPALLGFAVLAGLWLREAHRAPTRLDGLCVAGTRALVAVVGTVFVGVLGVLAMAGTAPALTCVAAAAVVLGAGTAALVRSARAQRRGDLAHSLTWSYGAYAAALCASALVALPVIDRWQDLHSLALRVHADTPGQALALLDPDETTLAVIDHGFRAPFTVLRSGADGPQSRVAQWFEAQGADARVLVLLPGHAPGELTRALARWRAGSPPGDGVAGTLTGSGAARLRQTYELPQGRRYALLGPPGH